MILILALGCTDPNDIAVRACEGLPQLSMDAVGQAGLAELLVASELKTIADAPQTAGHSQVGDEGMAELRKGTNCVVDSVDSAGSGRWAVSLTRMSPTVDKDGVIGAEETLTIEYQVVADDGGRVESGVSKGATMWENSHEAAREADFMRAASTMRALKNTFPDPVLSVDVFQAEQAEELDSYSKSLVHTFVSAEGDEVVGSVQNGDKALTALTVKAAFDVGEQTVEVGPVEAGAALEYKVPVPDGAEGNVKLSTASLSF